MARLSTRAFVESVIAGRLTPEQAFEQIDNLRAEADRQKQRAATFQRDLAAALRGVAMERSARIKWERKACCGD